MSKYLSFYNLGNSPRFDIIRNKIKVFENAELIMKSIKKIIVVAILLLLPFISVWIAYFLSNRVFAPEEIFFSHYWWFVSIIYYVIVAECIANRVKL